MKNIVIPLLAGSLLVLGQQSFAESPSNNLEVGKPLMQLALQSNKTATRSSGRVFIFDPRQLRWYAYDNGRLVASGRASGGAHYCKDIKRSCRTPSGVYRIVSKGSANCRSSRYPKPRGGARMDYCMFFSSLYAIHGSNSVPNYNASHGCVRVLPSAARWLNNSFITIGTKVIVRPY